MCHSVPGSMGENSRRGGGGGAKGCRQSRQAVRRLRRRRRFTAKRHSKVDFRDFDCVNGHGRHHPPPQRGKDSVAANVCGLFSLSSRHMESAVNSADPFLQKRHLICYYLASGGGGGVARILERKTEERGSCCQGSCCQTYDLAARTPMWL